MIAVSYNHSKYIKEAIESLLNQDYSPLEIIISDDHSTDKCFEIAKSIAQDYRGPHRIILNQNTKNLGIGGNVTKALSLANGELFVAADCDDFSEKNRVSTLVSFYNNLIEKPLLITTDCFHTSIESQDLAIKKCGDLQNIKSIHDWIDSCPVFFGCSNMYSKELFQVFGDINSNAGAIDQIMVLRAILLGRAHSLHTPLVHHREGGITGNKQQNITSKINRLISGSTRAIADLNQHIQDANRFGYEDLLKNQFKHAISEAKLIPLLLNATSLKECLRIFFNDHETPFFKKTRILSYVLLPLFHRIIFKIKRFIQS